MKNLIIPMLMMFAVFTATAQRGEGRNEKRTEYAKNMEPQQVASMQAKRLTLALDLTDKQQAQMTEVLMKSAQKKKEAMVNKESRKELSKEEKIALVDARLDDQIATKRAIKSILNEDQYAEFEKMKKHRNGKKGDRREKAKRVRK